MVTKLTNFPGSPENVEINYAKIKNMRDEDMPAILTNILQRLAALEAKSVIK